MEAPAATEQNIVSLPPFFQMPALINWAPPPPLPILDIAAMMKADRERIENVQNMVNAQLNAGDNKQALAEIRGAVQYPTTDNQASIHEASHDADSDDGNSESDGEAPAEIGLSDAPPMGVATIVTIMKAAADPFLDLGPAVVGMAGVELLNRDISPISDFIAERIDKASRVFYEQTVPTIATIGVVGIGAVFLMNAAASAAATRRKYL